MASEIKRVFLNGVGIFPFTHESQILDYAEQHKGILAAVNAEKILHATDQTRAVINPNIGYCDGLGALLALRRKGYKDAVKVPGVELWLKIVARHYRDRSFYLIGGKQEVIDKTVERLRQEYPGINIVAYRNGFIADDNERQQLIDDVAQRKPDIVFVAMGSPRQELLMSEMQQRHSAIYQGLGGSFDIYSGARKRAPKWWLDHNLEFAYRCLTQPRRLFLRAPHLLRMAWRILINDL